MINAGRSFSGHERNCVFLNTRASPNAGSRFANISSVSGLDFDDDARALIPVDWDHDGDLDLWISNRNAPRLRFLRNDSPADGKNSVVLRLLGNGTTCNRDAIGARVEIILAGSSAHRSVKTLRAGEGFLSQPGKWLHFGLGAGDDIEKVIVHWPGRGGSVEDFTGVNRGGRYLLAQGEGEARLQPNRTGLRLKPSIPEVPSPSRSARVPLVTLFPRPALNLRDYSDRPISLKTGRPLLLNLWASWCTPCLGELEHLVSSSSRIKDAGVQIVALSVDGLDDDDGRPLPVLKKIGWPFAAGRASERIVTILQNYHNALIALNSPLPVPASFLFDEKGRLSVIYKGPTTVETILQDLKHSSGTREERWVRAALLSGTTIDHDIVRSHADSIEAVVHFRNGRANEVAQNVVAAAHHYEAALDHRPEFAEAHKRLGNLYLRGGNRNAAVTHYTRALEAEPDDPATRFALGDTYRAMREWDRAAREYRDVLQINPRHLNTRARLADVLYEGGHRGEAIEEAEKALAQAQAENNHVLARVLGERLKLYRE